MYSSQQLTSTIAGWLDATVEDLHPDQPTLVAQPDGDALAITARLRGGGVQQFAVHVTEMPTRLRVVPGGEQQ